MRVAQRPRDIAPRKESAGSRFRSITPREPPSWWHSESDEEAWVHGGEPDASPAFEFAEWRMRGFTPAERDVWIDAGLRRGQAKIAAALRDDGLAPSDLQEPLHGWTIAERLTHGQGVHAVARLLQDFRRFSIESDSG